MGRSASAIVCGLGVLALLVGTVGGEATAAAPEAISSNDGTTATGTLGDGSTVGLDWTLTLLSQAGYSPAGLLGTSDLSSAVVVGTDSGASMLQFKAIDTTPKVGPDTFSASVTFTAQLDTNMSPLVLSQSANRLDAGTIVLTWSGGGTATLSDPDDQIANVADGAGFVSGQSLVVSAPGGITFASSTWKVTLPGTNVTYSYSFDDPTSSFSDSDLEGFRVSAVLTPIPTTTTTTTEPSTTTTEPSTTMSTTTTEPSTTIATSIATSVALIPAATVPLVGTTPAPDTPVDGQASTPQSDSRATTRSPLETPPATTPPSASATQTKLDVSGFVFVDKNSDGVRDANEELLSSVTVEVRSASGTLIAATTTDSQGRFSIPVEVTGIYTVTIVSGVPAEFSFLSEQTISVDVSSNGSGQSEAVFRVASSVDDLAFTGSNLRLLTIGLGCLIAGATLLGARRIRRPAN